MMISWMDMNPLKGFEIFKLSNPDNILASPNPCPPAIDSPSWIMRKSIALLNYRNAIATVAITIIAQVNVIIHMLLEIWEAGIVEDENKLSAKADRFCARFSLAELRSANKNFSDALVIGQRGFGKVYKGFIDIQQIQAKSVIMVNGVLLYITKNFSDVKASNILLNEKFVAKVSDFGLAKPKDRSKLESHVSTNVKGTFVYFNLYYFSTHKLTRKSDTYAFGVVVLEVLKRSGRPTMDQRVREDECSLIKWVRNIINKGKVDQIVDSSLIGDISPNSLKVFVQVAERCCMMNPKKSQQWLKLYYNLSRKLENLSFQIRKFHHQLATFSGLRVHNEELGEVFDVAGLVQTAEVIYNSYTNLSRGFGFVTKGTVEEANKAMEILDQSNLYERQLKIKKATPKVRIPRPCDASFRLTLDIYRGRLMVLDLKSFSVNMGEFLILEWLMTEGSHVASVSFLCQPYQNTITPSMLSMDSFWIVISEIAS
ncbi:hypothetical protein BUALT_Bualt05G0142300 [Buddleja alternifolia]|uniref:Uncharacterized protein n=1 Tax=Buddleja alternifolia TaxID=168488 RepID=A0AAV6XKM7_9LAMI|nr:hypothetical protein BUALT_Bualt05G0142300 [Buddleja alternifolia]